MKTIPVATFNEAGPAQQLRDRFVEAGLPASIRDESRLERFWFMSEPLAALHVEVDQPNYLTARRLMEDWEEFGGVMREAVRCPACRSSRVEFPQITRKFVTPVVTVLLMLMRAIPREFYCLDCHFTWPKEKRVEPELDILGWPRDSKLWHPDEGPARKQS
jgi:hypothetical protein